MNLKPYKRFAGLLISKENDFRKTINLAKGVINWKVFNLKKLNNYPLTMTICPGNICNLNCELCPTGQGHEGRKRGFMSFETFKKILDECGPYLYRVHLYNWGEPFLNKDIFKMIRYAKKYNIRITISSNLNFFNEEIAKNIIDSKLDWLVISLDGASNETVSKYQKGNNFDKVFKNMEYLRDLKTKLKKDSPIIEWRFIVNKYNEHEIDKARGLAKKNNFRIGFISIMPIFRDDYILKTTEQQFEEIKDWLPQKSEYSAFDKLTHTKKNTIPSCTWLWFSATINWDGSVTPCCLWSEKFDFGHISKGSFKNNWNNEKYQIAREVISGKKTDYSVVCQICKNNRNQANFF